MQPDCIIAITPARIGGLPWFARVLHWNKATHQVQMRWMDKYTKTNNSKYFYLTTEETLHEDTIICNGVDFQPIYGSELLWQLQTPLPLIRELQEGKQLITTQMYQHLPHQISRPMYNIEDMVFGSKEDFIEFVSKVAASTQ